jgi:hypothetical protein
LFGDIEMSDEFIEKEVGGNGCSVFEGWHGFIPLQKIIDSHNNVLMTTGIC